jgi:hypothetical protein
VDAITSLRENIAAAHSLVEGTMEGLTADQAHWQPPGRAHSIAALYTHIVAGEDGIVHGMLLNRPPLAATSWAGKTGLSEAPPQEFGDWSEWARKVRADLPALREYAQAVYAATDAYVASLKPEDLDGKREWFPGVGSQTLNWMIGELALHANIHGGEISALKGLQGLQGYPF